jgi:ribosomal-protein-alanine N-acetyltransferase
MVELIFKGTPQMETERLILRRLNLDDARDMFEYASDEQVNRYLIWDRHATIDNSREFIRFTMGRYERDETGDWGIVWRESGKLIGTVGFVWCDMNNRRAEIGYVLARPFWGQGIMPEAVGRIFQFGFTDMGLNRIECCHFLPNEKSGRVMQKVGMSFEGTARQKIFAKGQYWDVKQYAMLRSNFLGNS